MTKEQRSDLDAALAADGCRLRGNAIVREFTEGPLPLPCEPIVLVEDIELGVPNIADSEIPY